MKNVFCLSFLLILAGLCLQASAQVTNLTVNGSGTSFTMASGDNLSWQYNIPTGGTAFCDIWIDLNHNGTIDPGIDHLYLSFLQTDGDTEGRGGPPDLDGVANGHVVFSSLLGIAPGNFVMRFTHNNVGMAVPGTIQPLVSPVHTLSGHVTVPAGRSAQYILVQAERPGNGNPPFWHGVTDANGNYAIQMNADTAGNPWEVSVWGNPYPPSIIAPERTAITITGNHSGIDFSILQAAAQVAGYVKDENNNPLPETDLQIRRDDGMVSRNVRTNSSGFFQVGLLSGELVNQTWRIQTQNNEQITTTKLVGQRQLPVIGIGDSLYRQIIIYNVNAQIQGQVRVNGAPPGFPITIVAWNADTAEAIANADGGTGNFTVAVSNRIYDYSMFPIDLPPNFSAQPVHAHPGNTGVIIDITMTSVGESESGVPHDFALHQNFPNPFNPSTTIRYELPHASHVTLYVFNILGQQVAELVNERQEAGYHAVALNKPGLASGVYLYQLRAGDFSATRKFVVLK